MEPPSLVQGVSSNCLLPAHCRVLLLKDHFNRALYYRFCKPRAALSMGGVCIRTTAAVVNSSLSKSIKFRRLKRMVGKLSHFAALVVKSF
ncbi:hypothetical protein BaRGS_00002892 [Batillaria attramentaria]|uniref:Uncharacterized protein n=1 Tax=Batillaria attramentaria TaxID=370345 RepID=A0ABD0M2V4_9CAEN